MSRLGIVVEAFASFPESEPVPPPVDPRLMRGARINYLGEIPDGSGRLYVPDLNGTLYVLDNGVPEPYLDVKAGVGASFFSGRGLGSGLGFVAFHPDFAANGRFYTVHTEAFDALTTRTPDFAPQRSPVIHGVITEWTATSPAADRFEGSNREILRLAFTSPIHGIQQIAFDPTISSGNPDFGLLYIAVGDGGAGASSGDPQNLAVPYGKILRIDPAATTSTGGRYGIPAANPFTNRAGALDEIFAYGMRDPHRFSWDNESGRMFLAHIGEHDIEAVYEVRPGSNAGWTEREGRFVADRQGACGLFPLPANDATLGFTYPVVEYDHNPPPGLGCGDDVGRAISGGFVYRGAAIPELHGRYLFADLVDGRVMYAEASGMRSGGPPAVVHELAIFTRTGLLTTMPLLAGDARVDLRFGQDAAGELYLLSKANGRIWKIVGTRQVAGASDVFPGIAPHVAAFYDFEHPGPGGATEIDQGRSRTDISLINGGAGMRVPDGAYPSSTYSIQVRQVNPDRRGNDDWKAGVFNAAGVPGLNAFAGARGVTIMGWFRMTGPNPGLDSGTAEPDDRYGAIGLAGILSGDSDGHYVRALLEVISVDGTLRLVALGRRIDGAGSRIFAASGDWQSLLPVGEWVFLAGSFDFETGAMALYRNGRPLPGFLTSNDDAWNLAEPGEHRTSATIPRGIKIGGSFPQNTTEANPCDCRIDGLMLLDRVLTPLEINQQYRWALSSG